MRGTRAALAPLVALVLTLPLATATFAGGAPAARGAGEPLPAQVNVSRRVHQMITVTSPRWSSTAATIRAWSKRPSGAWHRTLGPVHAVIGWNGWVRALRRQQSTGTTPAGKFQLPFAFGSRRDPGTRLHYIRFDDNDYWPYEPRDPATYNVYEHHKAATSHWRPDYRERLWHYRLQYAYAVVVGFNLPSGIHYSERRHQRVARYPADTDRGGGIFLHVRRKPHTAGCVATGRDTVRALLRWLDPERHPRIVMGPRHYVTRL